MSAETWKWLTIATMVVATMWYGSALYHNRVRPAPAAWILGTIAMSLSWATYWETPGHTLIGNIGVITSTASITILTTYYLILLAIRRELRISFSRFQYGSLALTALIVLFWKNPQLLAVTNRAAVSFWLLQLILVLSYVVMVHKVLSMKRNPDSTLMWVFVGTAAVFAFMAAHHSNDVYGMVNSARAVLSSLVLVPAMVYYDWKNGRWPSVAPQAQHPQV